MYSNTHWLKSPDPPHLGSYTRALFVSKDSCHLFLKGPKREMFVDWIFTEIRPVWVGDLETRPKNLKSLCLGPYITRYFLGFLL